MLSPDFRWRQSGIKQYLLCGRRFELENVVKVPIPDHFMAKGYAAPKGTALHGTAEEILHAVNRGEFLSLDQLADSVTGHFCDAVADAQEAGLNGDPDSRAKAMEDVVESVETLDRFQRNPGVRAIHWLEIEKKFQWRDRYGRLYSGTVDAGGVAHSDVTKFGHDGSEQVNLKAGDAVVADWKTGANSPTGYMARLRGVQLAFYRTGLEMTGVVKPGARYFIGRFKNLTPPRVKKTIETINPAWVEASGLSVEEAEKSKKRPKAADGKRIPKRIETVNPEWVAAQKLERGSLFQECRVDHTAAWATIRHAIRGAEAGIFPASGVLTDQCRFCPYVGKTCLSAGVS